MSVTEVEGLQRQVRELEDNNTLLMELYTAASHGRECMENKLLLAEKQVEDYAVLNKEATKNLKHLQSKKQELESSLDHALEKLKEKQRAFEAYRAEMEISLATALELREECECEDLAVNNNREHEKDELRREIEYLSEQKIVSTRTGFASGSRKNPTSLGEIRKNSFGGVSDTTTCQTSTKAFPPVFSLRDEDGETSAAAFPMKQSSLPKYCLPPKPFPTSSAFLKSISRDPSSASPYIQWHDNPLYETQATRHTTAAFSGDGEVTNGSKSISSLSSASPFINWHYNPLHETQVTRHTTTALSADEEVTNGLNSIRDPSSDLPLIKWRYNPLYETQTTRLTTADLSDDEEITNDSKSIGSMSDSTFVKWHNNPLCET